MGLNWYTWRERYWIV